MCLLYCGSRSVLTRHMFNSPPQQSRSLSRWINTHATKHVSYHTAVVSQLTDGCHWSSLVTYGDFSDESTCIAHVYYRPVQRATAVCGDVRYFQHLKALAFFCHPPGEKDKLISLPSQHICVYKGGISPKILLNYFFLSTIFTCCIVMRICVFVAI